MLGGYLAHKHDPPPGNIVVWRGMTRLHDILIDFLSWKQAHRIFAIVSTIKIPKHAPDSFGSIMITNLWGALSDANHPAMGSVFHACS